MLRSKPHGAALSKRLHSRRFAYLAHPSCTNAAAMAAEDFYVRYYVGHKGKFGHEFLEFEFRPDGKVMLGVL